MGPDEELNRSRQRVNTTMTKTWLADRAFVEQIACMQTSQCEMSSFLSVEGNIDFWGHLGIILSNIQ